MPSVLCCGLVTADLFYHYDDPVVWGGKFKSASSNIEPGGGAAIAASAIAALGGDASVVGRIGQDILGDWVQADLNKRNVDTKFLQKVQGYSTPNSAIITTFDGERTVFNARDSRLLSARSDIHQFPAFDAVLTDTRWPAGAEMLLKAAQLRNKPAILDAEAPVSFAEDVIHLATHIIFSEQGLSDYAGKCDENALIKVARETGVWVAVTRGSKSVICCHENKLTYFAPPKVKTRNTLGAGDVWHGAFALSMGQTGSESLAVEFANDVAAMKVSLPNGYPTLAMLQGK